MDIILKQLLDRFPLLSRLFLEESGSEVPPQALPAYLGILLAVFTNAPTSPICFVLPRCGDLARLSVVLYVMHQLVKKQNELIRSSAKKNLSVGDYVRVYPGRHVFRYGGYNDNCPDWVWLETINNRGRWQVPATLFVNRLEKTTHTTPVGRLNSPILSPPPAPLDMLLGTSFFENHSLFENEVLILDSQSGFDAFVSRHRLWAGSQNCEAQSLKTLLRPGRIVSPDPQHSGWLRKPEQDDSAGEPLIAVGHSDNALANLCIQASPKTKLVVVNGLEHLRSLQSYDDISQTQRLIVFADRHDEEMIETLGKRGCKFWFLGYRELTSDNRDSSSSKLFESIRRGAEYYDNLLLDHVPCEDARLTSIWLKLDQLRGAIVPDDDTFTRLLKRVWQLFLNACSACSPPAVVERNKTLVDIGHYRAEVRRNAAWIVPDHGRTLLEIADRLADCNSDDSTLGLCKGAELLTTLLQDMQKDKKIAILAKNIISLDELRRWLAGYPTLTGVETFLPSTLPLDPVFDRIICVSWFGGHVIKQVVSKLVTTHVTIIAYPWERQWLRQCMLRLTKGKNLMPMLTDEEKSALISGDNQPRLQWFGDSAQQPTNIMPPLEPSILEFEHLLRTSRIGLAVRPTTAIDILPAYYVRFSGDSYAFLSESHKIPIATDLLFGQTRQNQTLPERTVRELRQGDFVVFPAGSGREMIQELADKLIGQSAADLRTTAHLWREALSSSHLTPEKFFSLARISYRSLCLATIRNWYGATFQIGPQTKDDLRLIAALTLNEHLQKNIDVVSGAIEKLRSAHHSAGVKLKEALLRRLPQVMGRIEENGTEVDLGDLGTAWIARVESIELKTEPRGRGEINRLLFEKVGYDAKEFVSRLA